MDQNELLKKTQKAELYLLIEFDKVCRQNGLTYFLDSGTALGAVRHGGFIPWDDDIDVGMPRKDYEKFMEIGQTQLPSNIFLQNRQTEKNYKRFAAKLRLEGTVFPETDSMPYVHNGIFIDIFPFDNIPSNKILAKLNVKSVIEGLHIVRAYRNKGEKESPSKLRRLFSHMVRILPSKSIDNLEHRCLKKARRYEDSITDKMTCYFWRMSLSKQYLFKTSKMMPVKDIDFEGRRVMIMNNPDYYLTLMYGDYMQLPPEDKRKPHLNGNVDFGSWSSDIL